MSEYKQFNIEEISSPGGMAYKASLNLDDYLFELTGMKPKEIADLSKAKAEGRLVEVVRCKDCVQRSDAEYEYYYCDEGTTYCNHWGQDRDLNDYCNFGKFTEQALQQIGGKHD